MSYIEVWALICFALLITVLLGGRRKSVVRQSGCMKNDSPSTSASIDNESKIASATSTRFTTTTSYDPDYSEILPPSRRSASPQLDQARSDDKAGDKDGIGLASRQFIPMVTEINASNPSASSPTSFTVREIEKLGRFPDYAKLSGVPLPKPYPGFDINKALPRPYRPLRWAYHQTMCMCKVSVLSGSKR